MRVRRFFPRLGLLWAALVCLEGGALAADLPSGYPTGLPTGLPEGVTIPPIDVASVLPLDAVNALVRTIAILTAHRPYQGATALGPGSYDFGVEATLVHLPNDFISSLSSAGVGGSSGPGGIGALPMARVHVHRGMSNVLDVGLSGLIYKGSYILGGDLKAVVFTPEEGFLWAVRLGYSETNLDLGGIGLKNFPFKVQGVEVGKVGLIMKSRAITPQVVASKRLDFAEPYVGGGLEWVHGHVEMPITLNVLGATQTLNTPTCSALGFNLFTGVTFKVPHIGLRIGLEGGYGSLGTHHMGLIVGMSF